MMKKQKDTFSEWGLLADWDNIYKTSNSTYISRQLDLFYELYNKGYIFKVCYRIKSKCFI